MQANHFFVITFYCVVRYYSKTISKKIERNVFETSSAISMTQKFKPNLPLFVTRNFENFASKTSPCDRKGREKTGISTSRSTPACYRLIRSIKWRQGGQANHFFVITFYCVVRYYSGIISKKIERNVFETSAISMTQKFKPNLPLFVTRISKTSLRKRRL